MQQRSDNPNYNDLKAELQALQMRMEDLYSKLEDVPPVTGSARRQLLSRVRGFRWPLALGFLVLAGALAQTSDPITVGPDGKVRIGTSLDVAGSARAKSFEGDGNALKISGNLTASEALAKKLDLTGGQITGEVGIAGAIQAKNSDIYFTKTDHNHSGLGNKAGNAAMENGSDYSALMILGRQQSDTNKIRFVRMWDKVGIAGGKTDTPREALDVRGNVLADKINGEKPPYVFEIGDKNDTRFWHSVQVPSNIIQSYLGDADGGTIKILFRVNSSDEVKVITETVYIEQPDKSNNKTPGLRGYTRQEGGGDQPFTLRNNARTDVIPGPFGWMWVKNHPGIRGRPGGGAGDREDGQPWSDYKLEFLAPPNVSATVVIYDR